MFIENMRHAKNKGRIWVGILMGLILISLFITYANVGGKSGLGASSSNSSGPYATAESTAKSAASDAKADKNDMDAQGTAASAYLSLAAYQNLYLDDGTKSYNNALKYAEAMVAACASAKEPDYATAYGYEFSAYQGLGDADGLSAAFNASLKKVTLSEDYLNSYYTAMGALKAYDQFNTDMAAVTDLLNKEAKEGTDTSALLSAVQSLIAQATAAASGATTDSSATDTTTTNTDSASGSGDNAQ